MEKQIFAYPLCTSPSTLVLIHEDELLAEVKVVSHDRGASSSEIIGLLVELINKKAREGEQ